MDEDGKLYHDGSMLDEAEVYHFFLEHLERNRENDAAQFPYVLVCAGERNLLNTADVPFVVEGFEPAAQTITLVFQGEYREVLDPSTLYVGKHNILYCKVRGGQFDARFSRKVYYELAKQIIDKRGQFFITIGGKEFCIPLHSS